MTAIRQRERGKKDWIMEFVIRWRNYPQGLVDSMSATARYNDPEDFPKTTLAIFMSLYEKLNKVEIKDGNKRD